jgi:hypothetical protein
MSCIGSFWGLVRLPPIFIKFLTGDLVFDETPSGARFTYQLSPNDPRRLKSRSAHALCYERRPVNNHPQIVRQTTS